MDDISGRFSEPVPDFNFSRSRPLIAFIVDEAFFLTHIAPARKGQSAGTELRRLHLENALQLSTAVDGEEIVRRSSPRLRRRIENCLREGGLLSPKAFEEVVSIVSSLDDEAKKALAQFSTERRERIAALSQLQRAQLAEQKEAVLTAMAIASIDRHDLGVWDSGVVQSQRTQGPTSFLDGLDQARLREDSMILNDLLKLPGFSLETQNLALGSAVFQNDQAKLTLVVANRLPLEQLTGADLIYYNETFSCFLMVQYKAMEAEDDEASFRFPNAQLDAEIHRMVELRAKLQACTQCEEADGFRFSDDPFFLKFCPRIVFDPDNIALAPGMYLPLGYWDRISKHPAMKGPRGGLRLSYRNVRRYLDNTEFVTIAGGGWVGTTTTQSDVVAAAIRATLEAGRAAVIAVNQELDERHRQGVGDADEWDET